MKPLRLTLMAFGPYAGREVVDFRNAIEAGLFGIYGATGSGKSSIFSAMTFALFGEATRAEQHTTSLRSDHAEPGLLTEVELIFEARGRTYRVLRRPEQMRPQKRKTASALTKQDHEAWLFDVTGLDLDTIDDANTGKVIAEKKVATVAAEVERILGYGANQFRQIVLLPQGRFETFLTATTEERLKILRDLFDVTLFRRVTEELKERGQKATQEIATARAVCERRLEDEAFATGEELQQGIETAKSALEARKADEAVAKAEAEAAAKGYSTAAETDKAFKAHVEAERHLAMLIGLKPKIDSTERRLASARSAAALMPLASLRDTSAVELETEQHRKRSADAARLECEAEAAKAADRLARVRGEAAGIEADRRTLIDLQRHRTTLAGSKALRAAWERAETASRDADDTLRHLDASRNKLVANLEASDRMRTIEAPRNALRIEEANLRRDLELAERFERARIRVDQAEREIAVAAAAEQSLRIEYEAAELAVAEAEAARLAGHAVRLAETLEDGEPCPVCGSREHPSPAATGSSEIETLAFRADQARKVLETARSKRSKVEGELAAAHRTREDRRQILAETDVPDRARAEIAADLARIEATLAEFGSAPAPKTLEADIEAVREELSKCEAERSRVVAAVQETATASALAKQALEQALGTIPQDLREPESLARAIRAHEQRIGAFEEALKTAELQERMSSDARLTALSNATHAANRLAAAEARLAEADATLAAKLSEVSLSRAAFEAAKNDVENIPELERDVASYGEKLAVARERFDAAETAIAHVDRPDLTALLEHRGVADEALKAATRATIVASERLRHLEKLAQDLAREFARLDALEMETAPIRELADLCAGKHVNRIDLETFAIAAMFDDVLAAANLRLNPMTRGRYHLVRDGQGRGAARRGLGIVVEDSFTGRQRATETLSGGETFIAALALALGLSDVVESSDGSIRLDTIFIDEGFGSLDSEGDSGTLEQVLDTLETLAAGTRAIGIISHVPLVQQAIPNGFWILKTASGSHIEEHA